MAELTITCVPPIYSNFHSLAFIEILSIFALKYVDTRCSLRKWVPKTSLLLRMKLVILSRTLVLNSSMWGTMLSKSTHQDPLGTCIISIKSPLTLLNLTGHKPSVFNLCSWNNLPTLGINIANLNIPGVVSPVPFLSKPTFNVHYSHTITNWACSV